MSRPLVLLAPSLLLLVLTAAFVPARWQEVEMTATDGFTLHGTFYTSKRAEGAVLLLHACDADRRMHRGLAESLARRGLSVLNVDLRGHGTSVEPGGSKIENLEPEARRALHQQAGPDVEVAYRYLLAQENVDLDRLAVVGSGCGGNRAIGLAARHQEVRALVLVSATVGGAAETVLESVVERPMLLVDHAEDDEAEASNRRIFELASHPDTRRLSYRAGPAQGTLLDLDPDLADLLAGWVVRRLR